MPTPRVTRRRALQLGWSVVLAGATVPIALAARRDPAPLLFGIYPGGGVGTVGETITAAPDDTAQQRRALSRLRGSARRPFVVRLYTAYTGTAGEELDAGVLTEIAAYTAARYRVELALNYRPEGEDADAAVAGFAAYVRSVVRAVGPDRRVIALQVTNEVNQVTAGDASDGARPGAVDALVQGTIAAADEARRHRFDQLAIGFNVADRRGRDAGRFWKTLRKRGGKRFAEAVAWVGVDLYPATWSDSEVPSARLTAAVREHVEGALERHRRTFLPAAGLGDGTKLTVAEGGYPTGTGRSGADQARVLEAMITTVSALRGRHGVTRFNWFDLRDADSANPWIESQYGLLRDDYAAKPAFAAYRRLVRELGPPPAA